MESLFHQSISPDLSVERLRDFIYDIYRLRLFVCVQSLCEKIPEGFFVVTVFRVGLAFQNDKQLWSLAGHGVIDRHTGAVADPMVSDDLTFYFSSGLLMIPPNWMISSLRPGI